MRSFFIFSKGLHRLHFFFEYASRFANAQVMQSVKIAILYMHFCIYKNEGVHYANSVLVIVAVHTVRFESGAEIIRVISARKANLKERNLYEHH